MRRWWIVLGWMLLMVGAARAQEAPRLVAYDTPITGVIGRDPARRVYAFDGLRGEVIALSLGVTSGDLDPTVRVIDGVGRTLAARDDSGGQRTIAIDAIRIPETSRYYVIVARFGETMGSTAGAFQFTLNRIGVSSASGSALRYGDSVINAISDAEPEVYYSVRARRGDIVGVRVARAAGDLDPFVRVTSSRGEVLAENDDIPGSGLDAAINGFVVREDDTLVIVATRFGGAAGESSGTFVLTLFSGADGGLGIRPDAGIPIESGDTVGGEITTTRTARYYTFSGAAGDTVTILMERGAGALDSLLILRDPFGAEIALDDDGGGGQNSLISGFVLPADGVYTIAATRFERDAGQTVGRYTLTLTIAPSAAATLESAVQFP